MSTALLASGCTGLLNQRAPVVRDGQIIHLSTSLNLEALGAEASVDDVHRVIHISGLYAGRAYTFAFTEDALKIEGLRCADGLNAPNNEGVETPVAWVNGDALHVDPGVRTSAGTLNFGCSSPRGGNFKIELNYLPNENQIVSGSAVLNEFDAWLPAELSVSGDGNRVAWSVRNWSVRGGASANQIVARDRNTNKVFLVSSVDGQLPGNGPSSRPAISRDGRWVAFQSTATNFVSGTADRQVYLKDLNNPGRAPVLVSSSSSILADQSLTRGDDQSSRPAISGDGRFVVFETEASNLLSNALPPQIVRKDMSQPQLPPVIVSSLDSTLADQSSYGADGGAGQASVSDDGRYVSFISYSDNLVPVQYYGQVYLKDMNLLSTAPRIVSSNDSSQSDQHGYGANNEASEAVISGDGHYLAFESEATNLGASGGYKRVYRVDLRAPTASPVIVSSADSTDPDQSVLAASDNWLNFISGDGRYVGIATGEDKYVPGSGLFDRQVYVKDMMSPTRAPQILSSKDPGAANQTNYAWRGRSSDAKIAGDGSAVFILSAGNYPAYDAELGRVFVSSLRGRLAEPMLLSTNPGPNFAQLRFEGNGEASEPVLSGSGRYLFFSTQARDLLAYPTPELGSIVLRRDLTQPWAPLVLVSGTKSNPTGDNDFANDRAIEPDASADGRYAVFSTSADNLVTGVDGSYQRIYLRDLADPDSAPVLLSSNDSTLADQSSAAMAMDCAYPAISRDGRYASFSCYSGSESQVYRKDLQALATPPQVVSSLDSTQASQAGYKGDGHSRQPRMSADGNVIVFVSDSTNFGNGIGSTEVYVKTMSNPSAPPQVVSTLSMVPTNQSGLASGLASEPDISEDGRYVAFNAYGSTFNVGTDFSNEIYVRDLQAPTSPPVIVSSLNSSAPDQSATSADSGASRPRISANGEVIVFSAYASNFPGGSPSQQVYAKRLSNLNAAPDLLSQRSAPTESPALVVGDQPSGYVSISSDGRTAVYQTQATDLSPGVSSPPLLLRRLP